MVHRSPLIKNYIMVNSRITLILLSVMAMSHGCSSRPQSDLNDELNLSQYRWTNRIIVSYSQSEDHPKVLQLKQEIAQNLCQFNNRNLLHFHVNSGTDEDYFRIILIGYDGGIKYDSENTSSLKVLFDLIDTMPMRRREMQNDIPC